MIIIRLIFLSTYLLATYDLYAEIMDVTVNWDNRQCQEGCAKKLQENYEKRKEFEKVSVNPTGVTSLKMKPGVKFSYRLIKRPMQRAGVGFNDASVKVRGTAKEKGNKIVLTSTGDGTEFELVSPIIQESGKSYIKPNPIYRELSPNLKEQIMSSAKEGKTLVIEGPLYSPHRSPPLQIIVSKVLVEKPKEETPNKKPLS